MAQVSAEQVLAKLKQNGTYDAMRQEMLESFLSSSRRTDLDDKIKELLERAHPKVNGLRGPELTQALENRVVSGLERQGVLEHLEKDARNFWLSGERSVATQQKIASAIGDLPGGAATEWASMVEVDPPRVVSSGARTHNYYRRGDAVVAFVSLDNAMCERQPAYICVAAEVTACDAKRNMYTVRDPDAPSSEAAQNTWVVYWDQLLAIKRPYEVKYHVADQVYALFREDGSGDTAVSTEFFPGHVLSVGQLSLAVRFDSGALAHVYYDEVFAAGRVGFLRTHSAERRRLGAADSMVESSQGKFIPSFTGFWPNEAEPQLGKHGRKVRYRQKPPILVSQAPPPPELHAASSPGSDMDIDNSSPEPLSPAPQPVARSQQPPMHRRSPVSEEDGEIGAEEGEVSAQHSRSAYDRRSRWDRRSPVRRDDRSRSRFDSRESYRPEYRRSRRSRSRSSSPPRPKHAYRW